MEYLRLSQAPPSTPPPSPPPISITRSTRNLITFPLRKNPKIFRVFASKDDGNNKVKFTKQDLMELKFGKMIGEDPKLTLAKIMGKKANPGLTYLEIEKKFYKNKGKPEEVKEVPFDIPRREFLTNKANGLNLVEPVPEEGTKVGNGSDLKSANADQTNKPLGRKVPGGAKSSTQNVVLKKLYNKNRYEVGDSVRLNLVRPVSKQGVMVGNAEGLESVGARAEKTVAGLVKNKVTSGSNVALRRPSMNDDSEEIGDSVSLKIKPNLQLRMRTEAVKEEFSGATLRKPETISPSDADRKEENPNKIEADVLSVSENNLISTIASIGDAKFLESGEYEANMSSTSTMEMSDKPRVIAHTTGSEYSSPTLDSGEVEVLRIFQEFQQSDDVLSSAEPNTEEGSERNVVYPGKNEGSGAQASESLSLYPSAAAAFQGKPRRPNPTPIEKSRELPEVSRPPETHRDHGITENSLLSAPLTELEESDWARAERLLNSADREEVELVSGSSRGFVVSFGSLTGFLPYHFLAARWKFLPFDPWLREKGLDPSKFQQKIGIIESYWASFANSSLESSWYSKTSKGEVQVTEDMEVEDLLRLYEREKNLFLSSFVGQKLKVNAFFVDKNSRKLTFSMMRKAKADAVHKKKDLMARLNIGDVVKCHITSITSFGVFVEVEGVPALIHRTEISWDRVPDPLSLFEIGQVVEAKVHDLDFTVDRIFLSLKDMTTDPLMDYVVEGINALNGFSEAVQTDYAWPEVDELIRKLAKIEKVQHVSRGSFFLSPGLAPSFQVFMASVMKDKYKLLARSENKVQEVIVEASLNKDEMKAAIWTCTNQVE